MSEEERDVDDVFDDLFDLLRALREDTTPKDRTKLDTVLDALRGAGTERPLPMRPPKTKQTR